MRKLSKFILCLLLLLTLLPVGSVPAEAAGGETVRVGWYESAFNRTDPFGRRSGYGYEYQQRIATYTGWTYEYVEGSWPELLEMLINGEIDLLSDISYTEERADKILYSAEEMGAEDYHIFISPDNNEIRPDDFSTLNGKRVGVNKNSIQAQMFRDWAQQQGVHPDIAELTAKKPEIMEMLRRGELDALVTLDTYGWQADVVSICKIGSSAFYFGLSKARPDLKQKLDAAMNRILEENRSYNYQLTEKYETASSVISFLSQDELARLSEQAVIRVGYQENYLPFCGTDENTQALTGALADFLHYASTGEKNAELRFEARPFDTTNAAIEALRRGEIDCLFPVYLSAYDGEQLDVLVTDPFINTEIYAIVRSSDRQGLDKEQSRVVAVKEGNTNYITFLQDYFPNWQPTFYKDVNAGLAAVAAGEADCALVSNYRLNRISDLCAENRLTTLATGEAVKLSFAVRREDANLYSILNKVSRVVPATLLNSSLTNYSFEDARISFADFLKDNLVSVIAVLAVVTCVILLLILQNVRTEIKAHKGQRLISEAERDRLTDLYNRSFFFAYANRLAREHPNKPMDAIVLNIERFHVLNYLGGHTFGDEVLRALGAEISAFLKENDGIAGRLESDHFDIYCAHLDDYRALHDRLQSGMRALTRKADIRLRMGVMPWQQGMPPETMFDLARSACSMVRGNYKRPLMVYNEKLRQRDEMDQRLQNDLPMALAEHQIEVYFQPKFDIVSQPPRLASAEALVRWRHHELGLIRPVDFIPLFEHSGQISLLDKYVWAEAARQIAAWRDRCGVTLPVSVNLSRVDVFDPELLGILDGIVEQNGLERRMLNLEVTESAYTENGDELIRIIGQLREKGYAIEMDDFGSGYSSLNMLSSMPIDILKMDMAFVRNIEHNERDYRFVELIMDIARCLNVPVIAEGVETEQQLKLLKDAGCALVQGYYFSRPLPADEFERKFLSSAEDRKI